MTLAGVEGNYNFEGAYYDLGAQPPYPSAIRANEQV